MLTYIWQYLLAGNPPHAWQLFGACYVVLEWALGRSKLIKANSTLDLILGGLKALVLKAVPWARWTQDALDKKSDDDKAGA